MIRSSSLAGSLLVASLAVSQPDSGADLVLRNGIILKMDDSRHTAEAIAIDGERIVAVGSSADIERWIGPVTRVIDLARKSVIPGLNETHIHVRDLGFQQHYAVNLEEALSIEDVQRMLRLRLEELQAAGKLGGWHYPSTGETGPWLFGL
ncbi:MAG TPA: hypothetical protein VEK15_10565, partial [Vicinamibacteria bacterium]|nr:hypothetical protein [Vicinamibacteria bacterium]